MSNRLERARGFLASRRIALVGASRGEQDFSRGLLRELVRRGYDVVPVNPRAELVEGLRCFGTVGEIQPPVEAALIMVPPALAGAAVRDCLRAGVRALWLHRGAGPGTASHDALEACRVAGVEPVTDLCPYMALPGAGAGHQLHGVLRRAALALTFR